MKTMSWILARAAAFALIAAGSPAWGFDFATAEVHSAADYRIGLDPPRIESRPITFRDRYAIGGGTFNTTGTTVFMEFALPEMLAIDVVSATLTLTVTSSLGPPPDFDHSTLYAYSYFDDDGVTFHEYGFPGEPPIGVLTPDVTKPVSVLGSASFPGTPDYDSLRETVEFDVSSQVRASLKAGNRFIGIRLEAGGSVEIGGRGSSGTNPLRPSLGINSIPEPASLAMLGTGALGLLGYARRRKAKATA